MRLPTRVLRLSSKAWREERPHGVHELPKVLLRILARRGLAGRQEQRWVVAPAPQRQNG